MSDTKLTRLSLYLCIPRKTEHRSKQINTFPQVRPLRAETSEPPLFHQTGPGADKQEVLNKRLPSQKDVSYIQSQLHGYGGVRLIIIHSGSTRTPLSHSWTLEPYARYL